MNVTDFQSRVAPWMQATFGPEISADRLERNHRFLEEALELVQSTGCTAGEAHELVEYVFGRPAGEPKQEVGGVMVTLAAHCLANGINMHAAGEVELARIWTKVEQIRAKQAAKPAFSPLPAGVGYAEFEIWCGDECCAGTSGPRERAWIEALHYAAVYRDEGAVRIEEITRRPMPLPEVAG